MRAVSSGDGLRVVNTLDVPTPPLYDLLGSPEQMCECGVGLQVADSWSPDSAAPSTVGTDGSSLKPSSQRPLMEGETSLQA